MSKESILPPNDGSHTPSTGSCGSEDRDSSDCGAPLVLCGITNKDDESVLDNLIDVKIGSMPKKLEAKIERRSQCCNPIGQCVWGVVLIILSVTGFVFTPLDVLLWEKMQMHPGLPPFEWWADPPDEVKLRVYVFNVTNSERYMRGLDEKLNVEEIGPIVYLEKLYHTNIRFNENSTMTYTATRQPIYLPEENHLDLNETLIVANLAVLGIASYLHNSNYLVRTGFKFLADSYGSDLFVQRTIYEYLWDFKDPVLDVSKSLAPGLVPVNNMGMLARVYANFTDDVTVFIGTRWGHDRFFQIDRFQGNPQLPGYDPDTCPDRIFRSTEGVMYQQHLSKRDTLFYWRKTVCKLMPLYFDSEVSLNGVPLYRYNLSEAAHDRITNATDCYDSQPSLPNGVSDGSKCYFDFPMVSSFPHFYTNKHLKDFYVTGLNPDRMKHNSYIVAEPLTGTPFHSVARMQSNLRLHDLSGFSWEYNKLSNLILPMFWAEYNQEDLPSKIKRSIYIAVVIMPPLSTLILAITILVGLSLVIKYICNSNLSSDRLKTFLQFKSKGVNTLTKNTLFSYEKDVFLKKTHTDTDDKV